MIKVRDLQKSFGQNHVLKGVSLDVEESKSMVIVGGSGVGKSVLLKCILGLIAPDFGSVEINNQTALDMDRVGVVFQGGALFDSLTVWENVAFRPLQKGSARTGARILAIEKLAKVGLGAEVADLYPSDLSGGMQKRAGLARAIATDPSLLFFDEPTAGLDPIKAGMINRLIRDILRESGATAITISHDLSTVDTVADTVAMLLDGNLHWTGTRSALKSANDPALMQFLSGSETGPIDPLV